MRLLIVLIVLLAGAVHAAPPRLAIVNGRVHPGTGTALLCVGDRIVLVGDDESVTRAGGRGAIRVDARGALILPGFHDPHVHLRDFGLGPRRAQLYLSETLEAALAEVARHAKAHPREPWVQGSGWLYAIVPTGQFPTRRMLDRIVPDRPVYLESYDGHACWVNTTALELAKVTAATPDPPGGRIVREADGKTPAGTLVEGAIKLVSDAVPAPSRGEVEDALAWGLARCAGLGITAIDDILADATELEVLIALDRAGRVPIRVRACPSLDDLDAAAAARTAARGRMLSFGAVKGFVDGVMESRTAALLDPYPGGTDRGNPLMPPGELKQRVLAAHEAGFQVALHAIGDGAVRASLDAFQAAQAVPRAGPPHRIEHCELVHPDDLPRFHALQVAASMQPMHGMPAGKDPDAGPWPQNVGPKRLPHTFPWRALLDARSPLAFGSDAPVVQPDPLPALAVALTRRDSGGLPPGGWNAHQTLDWRRAVDAYTAGSARAMGFERDSGALLPGMRADLIVLDPAVDPAKPDTLWTGAVAHVFVGGKRVAGVTPRRGPRRPRPSR